VLFSATGFALSVSTSTQLALPEGYPLDDADKSSSEDGVDDHWQI
jgi:hypothetical protein